MFKLNTNSKLGDEIASDMQNTLHNEGFQQLFSKTAAKKKEDKKDEKKEKKADKCKCSKACKNCFKDGKHNDKACKCAKKEDKKDKKSKKAEFESLVNEFVSLSEKLEDYNLSKTAAKVLISLDCLISEASGTDTIEEMLLENPELEVDLTEAVISEPAPTTRMNMEDEVLGRSAPTGEALTLEEQIALLEAKENEGRLEDLPPDTLRDEMAELGLTEPEPDMGFAKDIAAACKEIDEWIKSASEEDEEDSDSDEEDEDFEDEE